MGYNFVFTDADIMWFRDPFPRFHHDADFQIACDHFMGSSYDLENIPNGGFNFINRVLKFWYSSQEVYPGYHDQDVLNFIKVDPFIIDIGLEMRFLDTNYYFDPNIVRNLISTSVKQLLTYARNYLADLLETCINRVIYLDSDLVVVDDISKLWSPSLGSRTI
ncbi:hypothetical protein Ahy_A01g004153 [Arachis hypogaea]|uniref:Glycosyltransferase n=1 Tax=Arachis hypogaea TaxID=3818 RepID=A0A445EVE5_ARAHY|nr:hypothetical protein Ahy_A01g004153 [Arachis hypogaea]